MLIIVVIVLLSKWSGTKDKCTDTQSKKDESSPNLKSLTSNLIRDAMQWKQKCDMDQDPRAALMHSTYATAYLDAARTLTSDANINRDNHIDVEKLNESLQQRQQQAVQSM